MSRKGLFRKVSRTPLTSPQIFGSKLTKQNSDLVAILTCFEKKWETGKNVEVTAVESCLVKIQETMTLLQT